MPEAEETTIETAAGARTVSHFAIEGTIGSGGGGVVYRAVDTRLGRRVALKFLPESAAADAAMRGRLLEEARAAAQLDHPNVCTIFEVGESESGEIFIAMPAYDGETLDRVIARGPLEARRALSIALQIARGLAAAHEELIIHRDIKPGNVMLLRGDTVKILDFGLARLLRDAGAARRHVDGTPAYMSPEQLAGDPLDHRTDLWSHGVVLYEMLAGVPPFRGATISELAEAVHRGEPAPLSRVVGAPAAVDRIIEKTLAKNPRDRYESAEALAADVQQALSDAGSDGITARRPAQPARSTLAVLPFEDMSARKNQRHLCDGLAEEILRALSRIPDLYVASRTSAFQFRGCGDVREIGARLGVGAILEGSVRRAGDRVRVSVQLVNVADGLRLWCERFDREMKDIFAIEDEIAEQIAAALQVTLTLRSARLPATAAGAEAYELYLQGREFFHQHRRKALEIAVQTFARAIEISPDFARAYAGIADCHSFLNLYFAGGSGAAAAADAASSRAVELDPRLAEAQASRGLAHFVAGRYELAEEELRRALEIDGTLYEPHYIFGRICFARGRHQEAASHFRHACTIVPEAYDSWYLLGMCYRRLGAAGRAHGADLECIEAVKRRLRQHPDDTRAWTMGAAVLAQLGEPDRAQEWTDRALAIDRDEPIIAYNAACVLVGIGRHDRALEVLESLAGTGTLSRSWLQNDPDLDPLRGRPHFEALLEKFPP